MSVPAISHGALWTRMPEIAEFASAAMQAGGRTAVQAKKYGLVTRWKSDESPVSNGDDAANEVIQTRLANLPKHFPDVPLFQTAPIISEEDDHTITTLPPTCMVIDPIDGTDAYLSGQNLKDWTSLFSLRVDNSIALGVAYVPALRRTYMAMAGQGAFVKDGLEGEWKKLSVEGRPMNFADLKVAGAVRPTGSWGLTDRFYDAINATRRNRSGAGSVLKYFMMIDPDLFGKQMSELPQLLVRTQSCCAWDLDAALLIMAEAGIPARTLDEQDPQFMMGENFRTAEQMYFAPQGWVLRDEITAEKFPEARSILGLD